MQPSDFLRDNLLALEDRYPKVAELVQQSDTPAATPAEVYPVELELGRKGLPTLRATDADGSFLLHSAYAPEREATRFVDDKLAEPEPQAVILFGFGLGYAAEELLARLEETTPIIIVEPDPHTLFLAASARPLEGLFGAEQVEWIVGGQGAELATSAVKKLNLRSLRGHGVLIRPVMLRRFGAAVKEFLHAFRSAFTSGKMGMNTRVSAMHIFMTNTLQNLQFAFDAPSVVDFSGSWQGKPAILVAAGPSLTKQLPLLREVRDRFLVIGLGGSWKAMRNGGVEPHFLVSVDGFAPNFKHFRDMKSQGAWLVAETACNVDVVRTYGDRRIFASNNERFTDPLMGPMGQLPSGGSVANSAFSFARILGASPIVLIGQDLAYTGGQSHAPGHFHKSTVDEIRERTRRDNFRKVPAYYGGKVLTDRHLDSYRFWFERTIKEYPDLEVINATEGGARIEGAVQMPFRDVVEQYRLDEEVVLEGLWPNELDAGRASREELIHRLKRLKGEFRGVRRLAEKAMKVASELKSMREDDAKALKLMRRLEKLEEKIKSIDEHPKHLLAAFVQNATHKTQQWVDARPDDTKGIYELSFKLNEGFYEGSLSAIEALDDAIESIESTGGESS